MNPFLNRKQFVSGLIDILSTAISHNQFDDAETLLRGVRVLRPALAELGTFEAWIAIGRKRWQDAILVLNELETKAPNWAMGTALMAFCKFSINDLGWRVCANEVLRNSPGTEAALFVKQMMQHDIEEANKFDLGIPTTADYSQYDPRSARPPAFGNV